MNVFVVGSPLETAQALDDRRLNKQIIECRQMLKAIDGNTKAWAKHPCTLQYGRHRAWLWRYLTCLECFRNGALRAAEGYSALADLHRPSFQTQAFLDQMKRRLYTKDSRHYAQWAHLGTSEVNWYFVEGKWRYYSNGKKIEL